VLPALRGFDGTFTRVAVKAALPVRWPIMAAGEPMVKVAAVPGDSSVPYVVWGVTVTVTDIPLGVWRVQVDPLMAVMVPRTPCPLALPVDLGVVVVGGAVGAGAVAAGGEVVVEGPEVAA
jgi:hypothetical protein